MERGYKYTHNAIILSFRLNFISLGEKKIISNSYLERKTLSPKQY